MQSMLLAPASAAFLGAGTASPALSSRAAVRMDLAKGTLNVGVVGAGRIGLVHLEALAATAEAKPIIISNPTVSKAEAAAANYPGMEFSASDRDVINHPDVEAVWLCSPSQFHAEQIKACADAGKHVFCEKPIATDLLETIDAVNYCRKKNVKLMVALQRRFDPNFGRIKKAIVDGEIGEPIIVKLCSRDPAPPPFEYVKGGGGIFKDMAVHDLDMARFLMGCEPVKVLATGKCNIDKSIEALPGPEAFDTATIIVRFENGKDAVIDVCRQAVYGYDQRAEVLGTEGMVMSENMNPSTVRKFTGDFVGQADMPLDFFMSRYKEAYVGETTAFIDALVNDKPAPCSGRDGLVALVMSMAAGVSAVEERWVDFGEIIRNECTGDTCNFGTLLNSEGKLQENWVRGALLSIERDASSITDLQEVFAIYDTDNDGTLNKLEVQELLEKVESDVTVDQIWKASERVLEECVVDAENAAELAACMDGPDVTPSNGATIDFDEFLSAYKASGATVDESEGSVKGMYTFQNIMA